MIFPVLSVGYLAASRLVDGDELHIHSGFQRSLNLRHPDGYLLSILSRDNQNLPDAIRIALPGNWDWRYHMQAGQRVRFDRGTLQSERWGIVLNRSTCWHPQRWLSGEFAPLLSSVLRHYSLLASQLSQYCQQHQIESDLQLLPGMGPSARAVKLEITDSPAQLTAEVTALIGFGRGLTPDGDDYLLGYLTALWPWRQHPAIATHDATLRSIIGSQLSRTNDISRHYLARALEGHVSQPICDLMLLLDTEAAATQIQAAAQQVMQFGASSGVDCLAGLLHGLRTLRSVL
ncbi:oxamate carbamoyltransferase subunit AllH family protein [Serratia sp. D1N4]